MPSPESRCCDWAWLGRQPYLRADHMQRQLRERVRDEGDSDYLVLLEHPHVYTLGRNAVEQDVLLDRELLQQRGVEVYQSDRGGKVTYHGPGQLVGYPILDLSPDRRDLRRYMHDLQEVLLRVLAGCGLDGEARRGADELGVWVHGCKIASLGVHVSRWITTHGFALNVATDLSLFDGIVPCGLAGVQMASIQSLGGQADELPLLAARCADRFGEVFDRRMRRVEPTQMFDRWPIES